MKGTQKEDLYSKFTDDKYIYNLVHLADFFDFHNFLNMNVEG